jgi:hypothetical protein
MPEPSRSVVSLCEGARCRPLLAIRATQAATVALLPFLAELADRLRAEGAMGRVVVRDRRTGAVVATRRVWP